ncbi:MAG: hypothetical protein ACLP0B_22695 [Steroidobacteraceae bacterium]
MSARGERTQIVSIMADVCEYAEGYPVELRRDEDNGRLVIRATNEGGHNVTHVDLFDVLHWLKKRYSHLLVEVIGDEAIHGSGPEGD